MIRKFSISEFTDIQNKLKKLKSNIDDSLDFNYFSIDVNTIQNIENLYNNYLFTVNNSIYAEQDEYFEKRIQVQLCSYKISAGLSIDENEIYKVLNDIEYLEDEINKYGEEEPEEAYETYGKLIVPNVSIIYSYYYKFLYSKQNYKEIIKLSSKLTYFITYYKEFFYNVLPLDKLSEMHLIIAESLFYSGYFDKAFIFYDKAIRENQKCENNYIKKAIALFKLHKHKDAEKIYLTLLNSKKRISKKTSKNIYINLCKCALESNDLTKANKYLDVLLNKLNISENNLDILYIKARILDLEGNYKRACNEYEKVSHKQPKNSMNKIFMGICYSNIDKEKGYKIIKNGIEIQLKNISNKNTIPKSLYIYRPINERTLATIQENYIGFSEPKDFNDPLDSIYCMEAYNEQSVKNVLNKIKIRCFSAGTNSEPINTLMWSHYAKEHSGIAIEYSLKQNLIDIIDNNFYFNKVSYSNTIVDIMEIIEYQDYVKAFFTKDPLWEYENEYRLITFENQLEKGYKLTNSLSIESITFGYKTSDEYKN